MLCYFCQAQLNPAQLRSVLYRLLSHRSHWHRAPTFKGPPKYIDLIYFCNILVISVMHLQFFLPFSLKIPKFSALRAICFPFSWFFSKCSLNLSIYHNTFVCMGAKIILCLKPLENMTYIRDLKTFWHRAPKKVDMALPIAWGR